MVRRESSQSRHVELSFSSPSLVDRGRLTDQDELELEVVGSVRLKTCHPVCDRRKDDGGDESKRNDVPEASSEQPSGGPEEGRTRRSARSKGQEMR
jgi:hypothetical protein